MNLRRVFKWGGSLLTDPRAFCSFRRLHSRLQAGTDIIVVGGGARVDEIRLKQRTENLSDIDCHWMSVEAMSSTARQVCEGLPKTELIHCIVALPSCEEPRTVVFDCSSWLKSRSDLPHSWSFTSDSIAAALAHEIAADELVLLKSCLPNTEVKTLRQLSDSGFTDSDFSHRAAGLPKIRIIDLRGGSGEVVLVGGKIQATLG